MPTSLPTHAPIELAAAIIREPLVVDIETKAIDAIAQMSGVRSICNADRHGNGQDRLHHEARSSCVMVVEDERLAGILTERDVVRLSAQQQPVDRLTMADVMVHPVVTQHESELKDLFQAVSLLQQHRIRHLPVLDDRDRLAGVMTHESLRHIARPIDLMRMRYVAEVMSSEVVCANPACSMLDIARKMTDRRVSSVVIVELQQTEDGTLKRPLGILTERDLVQFQALGLDLEACSAASMMSTPIFAVPPTESLWAVQQTMEQQFIQRLAVTGERGELLGIITQSSLLRALNPLEIYKLAEVLENKVLLLEAEKIALLENRATELELEVKARTEALNLRANREKMIAQIATQIRSSLSLQCILETTVQQIRQVLQCDRVNIWQFGPNWESQVVAESTDSSISLIGERIDDTCFKQTQAESYRQGKVRVVSDIYTTEMSDCHRDMLRLRLQTRAKVLVPLMCGDKLWGLLNTSESDRPRDWQPEEVELLQALAAQLGIALQQATTHQQLQDELKERREADARLRASERRYASLVEASPVGILRTDGAGHCTYINERFCKIAGLTPDATAGLAWQQRLHPSDRDGFMNAWTQFVREGKPFQLEYRFQHIDGTETWVYGQSAVEKDDRDRVISYVSTISDISDRKRTERRLAVSVNKYRSIFDRAAVGIVYGSLQGDPLVCNPHFCQMLGYSPGELAELTLSDITYPDDFDPRDVPQLVNGKVTHFSSEKRYLRKDGTAMWSHTTMSLLKDDLGRPLNTVAVIKDISDRKQAEAQLQNLISGTAATTGGHFFPALVESIATALDVTYATVTERVHEELHTLAFWANGKLQENIVYHPAHTPCERTLHEGTFYCKDSIQEMFPQDIDLIEMGAEGYLGIALRDTNGKAIGNLCILDKNPIQNPQRAEQILSVFAARAAAELERQRATLALEQLNQDLEVKIEERTTALHEREQFLQTVLDTFPLSVFWKNRESIYLGCNRNFLRDAGLSSVDAIIGKTDYDMPWAKSEADAYRSDDSQVMTSNTPKLGIVETQIQASGHQLWLETNKLPLHNLNGDVVGVLGTYQDISTRKRAEQAMSRQLAAIEAAIDGVAILQEGRYQYLNRAHLDLFGYEHPSELIGQSWEQLYSETELLRFERSIFPQLERDRAWQGESVATRKDGSTFAQGVSLTLTEDNLLICVCRDISDRKRVEKLVKQQAERETLLRQITQRIRQSLDLQTTFVTAAQEIRRFLQAERVGIFQFDVNSEFASGEFVAEASVPGLPSVMTARVRDCHFSEEYAELYCRGRIQAVEDIETSNLQECHRALLAQFHVRANLVLPLVKGQELWGLLCIHQCSGPRQWQATEIDFTREIASQLEIAIQQASLYERLQKELNERQLAQFQLTERNQQLALSNEELARATRLKDEFLANMSHELRTPLNAILGMAEGLQEEVFGNIEPRQHKALDTIERSGSHLLELINDILDIAKIEAGQLELDCRPTSISLLCSSSLSFIKQQALKKRIRVEVQCAAQLSDLDVDERRMRQVLINLLNNAVKFTPEGGHITLTASIQQSPNTDPSTSKRQSCLRISVEDTGIGIAANQINRLFQPFIQVDSALNRRYQGTGLGLALVKRIVELHGGKVGVTSEPGCGSCFTIDLPYDISVEIPLKQTPLSDADNLPSQISPKTPPLILMAEDNEANISTISSYLKAKGYHLIFAKTGEDAVRLAYSETPDLVLMDIQMPGMDGIEAMQHIRNDARLTDTPIVALTALAMAGDRERCLAAGANDYLSKPIKLKQLVTTIQQLLNSREQ